MSATKQPAPTLDTWSESSWKTAAAQYYADRKIQPDRKPKPLFTREYVLAELRSLWLRA